MIHFTALPERDFGVYASGYATAARNLAQHFLSQGDGDYEAYPVVFLYRHALELYLKDIVVKGLHLAATRGDGLLEHVTYDHDLSRLLESAVKVLRHCFQGDESWAEFLRGLEDITKDFALLDKSSFIFRYPVDKQGTRPVAGAIYASVLAIASTMDPLLEQLGGVSIGLDVEIEFAEDARASYLHDLQNFHE